MMKLRRMFSLSLGICLLAACSPQQPLSNAPFSPAPLQNQSGPVPVAGSGNLTAGSPATQASAPLASQLIQSQTGASLQTDLTLLHDDEAVYQDTLNIASSQGFGIQMLDDEEAETGGLPPERQMRKPKAPPRMMPPGLAMQARNRLQAHQHEMLQEMRKLLNRLEAAAAVQMDAEGKVEIDAPRFRRSVKEHMHERQVKHQQMLKELKPKMHPRHELHPSQKAKLKRPDFLVRTSDTERIENADGSITEVLTVSFENQRAGIQRQTILSKTILNDALIKLDYELEESTPAFERTASRVVTVQEDGSKNMLLSAKTTWKNGKVKERHEERLIQADGSASGTGTLTITRPDGQVVTREYTLNITAAGQVNSACSEGDTTVTVEEEADGSATVVVEGGENTEALEVDLESEAEATASNDDADDDDSVLS
ncbi:MAG: hypothetical protein IGS03_02270 [Candidatus Sericytochromatia bacterium]|nr:hypothetical protein [Candidatus Sericytochromatia bacterium]